MSLVHSLIPSNFWFDYLGLCIYVFFSSSNWHFTIFRIFVGISMFNVDGLNWFFVAHNWWEPEGCEPLYLKTKKCLTNRLLTFEWFPNSNECPNWNDHRSLITWHQRNQCWFFGICFAGQKFQSCPVFASQNSKYILAGKPEVAYSFFFLVIILPKKTKTKNIKSSRCSGRESDAPCEIYFE